MKKSVWIVLVLVLIAQVALSQGCAVCTKAAAGLDDKSAKGLNGGIIYLAFLPLVIMGTLGVVWYRHHKGDIIASDNRKTD
jgi:hypothetical protein